MMLWSCYGECLEHNVKSLFSALTGKNKSSMKQIFQMKTVFPYWQTAHQCTSKRFCRWKKIKTKTTILQSKELRFILTLHEFWPQSNNFCPFFNHLLILPGSPIWQQVFSTASCNFWIESLCSIVNTPDGHFRFYLFSYSGFQIQYPWKIVTLKKTSIPHKVLFLLVCRLFLPVIWYTHNSTW